ncbi:membrane protein [Terrihabitans soli]|uniref:Membrane protein n=1 Tax=Terrihabitans soli TaxID=708113 RepID=A0A6S6QSU8_9HYPH|nr:outer membrane protein [Terrihabitans soli]BCJ90131.1 membrane protein [Terrihabitans soli]
MRVKGILFAAALGALPSSVLAADAPVISPIDAAIVNAAHDWAGGYVGVNAGYGWGEFDADGPATLDDPTYSGDGALGGFQIGYNKQLGTVVIGVEGDLQATNIEESTTGGGATTTTSLDWFSTARGRVGYAFDQTGTLVYGTAGLAIGGVETSVSGAGGGSDDQVLTGFAAGAGVEQSIADNLSLKAEYLYVDLQEKAFDAGTSETNAQWDGHVMRFGANLKF